MEFVYVVERHRLFPGAYPHGLVSGEDLRGYLERIEAHGFFVERRKAEQEPQLKQIIPYVVVHDRGSVLLLRRGAKQGESRLHGKLSLGIGGHINPVDGGAAGLLAEGLRRELEEELHLEGSWSARVAGVLNDDTTPVGAVHFGLVARVDVPASSVRVREVDMMEGSFVEMAEIRRLHRETPQHFETWSSLLLEHIEDVLAADLPLEQAAAARRGTRAG